MYNKYCAEDVLKALATFSPDKKKVFIQDLKAILPDYEYDMLEATCVSMARAGIINAGINTLKTGDTITHIKL